MTSVWIVLLWLISHCGWHPVAQWQTGHGCGAWMTCVGLVLWWQVLCRLVRFVYPHLKNTKMFSPTLLDWALVSSVLPALSLSVSIFGGQTVHVWHPGDRNRAVVLVQAQCNYHKRKRGGFRKGRPRQQNKAELHRIPCRTWCPLLLRRGHEKHKYSTSSSSPCSWFSFSAQSMHPLPTSSTVSPFSQAGQCVRDNLCTKTKRRSDLITC